MAMLERGKVQGGNIVFSTPLGLPDGTEVTVHIELSESVSQQSDQASEVDEAFVGLPFFGMWAGREEMADSLAWVRKERQQWNRRATRQD